MGDNLVNIYIDIYLSHICAWYISVVYMVYRGVDL